MPCAEVDTALSDNDEHGTDTGDVGGLWKAVLGIP